MSHWSLNTASRLWGQHRRVGLGLNLTAKRNSPIVEALQEDIGSARVSNLKKSEMNIPQESKQQSTTLAMQLIRTYIKVALCK